MKNNEKNENNTAKIQNLKDTFVTISLHKMFTLDLIVELCPFSRKLGHS